MRTFPTNSGNGDQVCINTNVIEDSIFEQMESFLVVFTTSDSNVNILNGRFKVIVEDNDSKHYPIQSKVNYLYLLHLT